MVRQIVVLTDRCADKWTDVNTDRHVQMDVWTDGQKFMEIDGCSDIHINRPLSRWLDIQKTFRQTCSDRQECARHFLTHELLDPWVFRQMGRCLYRWTFQMGTIQTDICSDRHSGRWIDIHKVGHWQINRCSDRHVPTDGWSERQVSRKMDVGIETLVWWTSGQMNTPKNEHSNKCMLWHIVHSRTNIKTDMFRRIVIWTHKQMDIWTFGKTKMNFQTNRPVDRWTDIQTGGHLDWYAFQHMSIKPSGHSHRRVLAQVDDSTDGCLDIWTDGQTD